MNTLENKYDSFESFIYNEGLKIHSIDIHQELDLMLVILNTKAILRQKLSDFPALVKATKEQLFNYQIFGEGTGIHWPELDEDLSLKGFLQNELKNIAGNLQKTQAA